MPKRLFITYCEIQCSFIGCRGERKQKIRGFFTLGMQNTRERNALYCEIKIEKERNIIKVLQ